MRFRVINYCRMKDVFHNGGQPFSFTFKNPLGIMTGFSVNSQTKMIGRTLQEMFPPINPEKLRIQSLKRVVCFTYSPNKKVIYMRHYKIIIQEGGVDKSFAKLLDQKNMDLSNFTSIGEYLSSLGESAPNENENQQKVRLVQMGPRLKLKFMSYEEKSGKVNYEGEEEEVEELQNVEMGG